MIITWAGQWKEQKTMQTYHRMNQGIRWSPLTHIQNKNMNFNLMPSPLYYIYILTVQMQKRKFTTQSWSKKSSNRMQQPREGLGPGHLYQAYGRNSLIKSGKRSGNQGTREGPRYDKLYLAYARSNLLKL